jgi:tetratricopeptide (TPR) repeat protein
MMCPKVHPPYFAAIALLTGVAVGQEGSATLEGTIRDSRSLPVPDISVLLLNSDQAMLTARTNSDGKYRFASISGGTYTLRAELAGFTPSAFGPFVLSGTETKHVDLILAPEANFFEEPNFIVAGITDTINRGGHGSETVVRSAEMLTRAAAALSKESAESPSEKSLQEAIAREPANAELHHSLGDVLEKRGNALEAAREYQRAAELNATENNLFDWGAELLTHRAADPAIEVFAKGSRLFPGSVRMLLGFGAALYAKGSYDESARRLFEAVDLNPRDPIAYQFLGNMLSSEIAQSDGLLERLRRFARLQPDNALASYYYAAALWRRWKGPQDRRIAAQVEALLKKAVRQDQGLGVAYLQLGILHSSLGDFTKAIIDYEKAIATGSTSEEAHYRLAQSYQRVGEKLKAGEEFEIYERLRQVSGAEEERRRSEIQQFVFALKER